MFQVPAISFFFSRFNEEARKLHRGPAQPTECAEEPWISVNPLLQILTPECHFPVSYQLPWAEVHTQAGTSSPSPVGTVGTELAPYSRGWSLIRLDLLYVSVSARLGRPCTDALLPPLTQIKTEDLSDSLQQTLSHRPCHLSQGPAMMSGNQMSGVNASLMLGSPDSLSGLSRGVEVKPSPKCLTSRPGSR